MKKLFFVSMLMTLLLVHCSNIPRFPKLVIFISIDQGTPSMINKYNHLFSETKLQMIRSQAMNERDYGDLVGLNKKDTSEKYGNEQVHIWRRSFEVRPPGGESLSDVINRVKPYFKKIIYKEIENNNNVLMSAHGNSLRALFFVLGFNNSKDISMLEIPTGKPFLVEFKQGKIVNKNYL